MHDYYFSIRSTTGVGFHTVLGSPTLPVNEQVISFKMAKLQGWDLGCIVLRQRDDSRQQQEIILSILPIL